MPDWELLSQILDQVLEGIRRIERRCADVSTAEDFIGGDEGLDRLDGIAMMLIAIGESIKKFERSGGGGLMAAHPEVDWKGAKGVRDFLSHQYFSIDPEAVLAVCRERIGPLKRAVVAMHAELGRHGRAR